MWKKIFSNPLVQAGLASLVGYLASHYSIVSKLVAYISQFLPAAP